MSNIIQPRMTFEEYLTYDANTDNRYEWIDGALIEMPTESEFNAWLSLALQLYFIQTGFAFSPLFSLFELPAEQIRIQRNRGIGEAGRNS